MSTTIETTIVPEITVATEQEEHRRDVLLRAAELIEERGWGIGSRGLLSAARTASSALLAQR